MNSPFALLVQKNTRTWNFRVNNKFWQASDIEGLLRDVGLLRKHGWHVDHVRMMSETELEVNLWRRVTAWRAFMEPYPVIREER